MRIELQITNEHEQWVTIRSAENLEAMARKIAVDPLKTGYRLIAVLSVYHQGEHAY